MVAIALLVASVIGLMIIAARRDAPAMRRKLMLVPLLLVVAALALTPSAFAFQKWLGRLVMPPALLLWALLALSLVALRERRRGGMALCGLFFAYALASNTWVSLWCANWLEAPFAQRPRPAHYDAVIVLGGAVSLRPWGEPQLSMSGDRVATAADLFHSGQASRLVCTGPVIGTRNGAAETMHMLRELRVPDNAVLRIEGPRNTAEEIAAFAELAREQRWLRLAIVTSAWHLPRALQHVRRQDISVVPIAADFLGGNAPFAIEEVLPSSVAFYRMQVVSWELLGMAMGR